MARSLRGRILLGFLGVSLAGTLLALILSGRQTANEFGHFLTNQSQEAIAGWLEDYYTQTGSWVGVAEDFPAPAFAPGMHMPGPMHAAPFFLADPQGRVLVGGPGYPTGSALAPEVVRAWRPLQVDGAQVGSLAVRPELALEMGTSGEAFLERVNQGLLAGAVGGTAAALVFASLLAGSLTRPLRELTRAARSIAEGHLGDKVRVGSDGEVGELARSFNHMSAELARTSEQRRQLSADIAHELRTPLSVILGHAEALRDGVLPLSRETLGLIHDEATRLNRMVEDLRLLSLTEAGELRLEKAPTMPATVLERAAAAHAPRAREKNIDLRWRAEPDLPMVLLDPGRIAQVLDNLMENALRYTPVGGAIRLRAEATPEGVRFGVQDSGPGIPTSDLGRVFGRFYRTDAARSREQGGSGLGLAIARSIVRAHGGRIWAEGVPDSGAIIAFELPLAPPDPSVNLP